MSSPPERKKCAARGIGGNCMDRLALIDQDQRSDLVRIIDGLYELEESVV